MGNALAYHVIKNCKRLKVLQPILGPLSLAVGRPKLSESPKGVRPPL